MNVSAATKMTLCSVTHQGPITVRALRPDLTDGQQPPERPASDAAADVGERDGARASRGVGRAVVVTPAPCPMVALPPLATAA
jgi:hypothetical protein